MDVSKADPSMIYGAHGGLQASRDGGRTWRRIGPASEELIVAIVMVAFDGSVLDRSVHPLDLAIGPWVVWLGEAMLDAMFTTDLAEAVDTVTRGPAIAVAPVHSAGSVEGLA